MRNASFFGVILLGIAFAGITQADELLVPDQYDTIQAAIDAAQPGDHVIIAPGTYTGEGNRDLDFLGKPITVRSTDPCDPSAVAATIIDCRGAIYESHAGFIFHSGETAESVVAGLTITSSSGTLITSSPPYWSGWVGNAIFCEGASPTITQCIITYNRNGGISCIADSRPTITDCRIVCNYSPSYGSGIFSYQAAPVIDQCMIMDNWPGVWCIDSSPAVSNCAITYNRGGIECQYGANPTITNCTINRNRAGWLGGGISCRSNSNPTITNCTISDNWSEYEGGGICCRESNLTITNCTISGNLADYRGGGIYCLLSGPNISNCTITGNTAGAGGAVYLDAGNPIITNCTIADNKVDYSGEGGGIYCDNTNPIISNCILWWNTAGEIHLEGSSSPLVTFSNVRGGWPGAGNIGTDPRFVLPGRWEDDVWVEGDYRVALDSPCVDAATNSPEGGLPATDIEGNTRPQDGDRNGVAVADMGAYEYSPPQQPYMLLTPGEFEFSVLQGEPNPPEQILQIRNLGVETLNWQIDEDCPWLEVFPTRGSTAIQTDEVAIRTDAIDLSLGTHTSTLTVCDSQAANTLWEVPVTLFLGVPRYVPAQYPTIQAAIDDCNDGDVVIVAPGTYTDDGNRDIHLWGKSITVRSTDPCDPCVVAATIIDCQGTGSEYDHGFHFCSGENSSSVVAGFTITNGFEVLFGGAIWCESSSPTITNCIIKNSSAAVYGGGISLTGGSDAIISNCIISGNTAERGGGIYCWSSGPTINNCCISGNTAERMGSGIYCGDASDPIITNCIINGNTAGWAGGGGIYCGEVSNPMITNCVISENTADWAGGIVCNGGNPRINGCIINGNSADGSAGGGISCGKGCPIISNCSISGNVAETGGGIYCFGNGDATIANSIIWANSALNGPEIALRGHFFASHLVVSYSDVQAGEAAAYIEEDCTLTWGEGNIDVDPGFVDAGGGDYHLLADSNCIDAGDPGSDFGLEPEPDGGRINMGAYGNTPEATSKGALVLQSYNMVDKQRVDRTIFDYLFTVTLRNNGSTAVTNVQLDLLDASSNVDIVDPNVSFAFIDAGQSATSQDTFSIRVDRSELIDAARISWRATFDWANGEGVGQQAFSSLVRWSGSIGDVTGEGRIDIEDLVIIAQDWLQSSSSADIAPVPPDGTVNLRDFAILAENWLSQ